MATSEEKQKEKEARAARKREEQAQAGNDDTTDDGDEQPSGPLVTDASSRVEGTSVQDVSPAPSEGPHSSDAADYPFPPQGDVDVATVDDSDHKGEKPLPYPVGSWIILAEDDSVPEEFEGSLAVILESPTVTAGPDDWSNRVYQDIPKNAELTVRVRESGAVLVVPYDAVAQHALDRATLVQYG